MHSGQTVYINYSHYSLVLAIIVILERTLKYVRFSSQIPTLMVCSYPWVVPAPVASPIHLPSHPSPARPRWWAASKGQPCTGGREEEQEAQAASCPTPTLFGWCVGLGPSAGPCLCLVWGRPLTSLFPDVKPSSLTPSIGAVIPLSTDVNQKKMKTTHILNWVNSNF